MSVDAELCGFEIRGQRTLGVKVRNTSAAPIKNLTLMFEWENEKPQPCPDGSRTEGGGTALYPATVPCHTLPPGGERVYYLDVDYLEKEVIGRVAALSPERYWVEIQIEGQTVCRIPGNLIGGVLDGLGL